MNLLKKIIKIKLKIEIRFDNNFIFYFFKFVFVCQIKNIYIKKKQTNES